MGITHDSNRTNEYVIEGRRSAPLLTAVKEGRIKLLPTEKLSGWKSIVKLLGQYDLFHTAPTSGVTLFLELLLVVLARFELVDQTQQVIFLQRFAVNSTVVEEAFAGLEAQLASFNLVTQDVVGFL